MIISTGFFSSVVRALVPETVDDATGVEGVTGAAWAVSVSVVSSTYGASSFITFTSSVVSNWYLTSTGDKTLRSFSFLIPSVYEIVIPGDASLGIDTW